MAVPKRKTSKARRDSRRSSNWKLSIPGIVECPKCHARKLAHRVCKSCGYYGGERVINVDKDEKKANA
ncbi:MAG: 50S ribosomal protein L32 [Candidatus Gastranaerophilaceae bacterium]|jgi:large subunit ribosomal protein L32|nr:50S ribosomal protein L32 [Christensenellales bacterium]